MGVLPLQFKQGESADTLGLKGTETFTVALPAELALGQETTVTTSTG
jgi:aconitate hydratase